MPKSYSGDLRERVIEAVEIEGASRREAAERFGVLNPIEMPYSVPLAGDLASRLCKLARDDPRPSGRSAAARSNAVTGR